MKSILLPTDFSNNSLNAIHYAIGMFAKERCEFFFLNVQKVSSFTSDDLIAMEPSTTIYQNLIETSKKKIETIINDVRKKFKIGNHIYHSIVDYDNLVDSINQIVKSKNIDLIVMGTKGATGAEKIIFGSNAVRVIKGADSPILAIPDNCKFENIDRIAFPTDYLYTYQIKEMKPLVDLAEKHNAKIDILHVTEGDHLSVDQENKRSFLDECFINLNHEFLNLKEANLFQAVEHFILYNEIDLLAMIRKNHSFLDKLFKKHHIKTFAFKVSVPFLVLKSSRNLNQ